MELSQLAGGHQSAAGARQMRRLCIIRTTAGRDYHFPLSENEDQPGYRLQWRSDSLHLIHSSGAEKMIFYKENVEVMRFEEGLSDGSPLIWTDPIL